MNIKNIDALVNEALSIEQEDARQANTIGYMARAMIQATMPHSKVDGHEFKRSNGLFKLTMLTDSEIGLPYGSIPRLLMSWITTEAVRTQQREIILGNTLSEFMAELDMIPSGGRWGSITRLKGQMKKLFATSISVTCSENNESWGIRNITPVEKADLWWDTKNPNQAALWESKLLLGEPFFNEVIENPVPIDMRALKALKQSPMAIDIYCWLTYRMSYLRRITSIPWPALQIQFGSNYKDVRQFKRKFLGHLKKVLLVYPDARIKDSGLSLTLSPSKTHIKQQGKLKGTSETINNTDQAKQVPPENAALTRKDYAEYRINSIISLIDEMPDEDERHSLLKEFENHLARTGQTKMRTQIINNKYTLTLKKELYHFVDNNWNHVLSSLKSYVEFNDEQSK